MGKQPKTMPMEEEFSHDYGSNRLLAAKRARKRAEGDYQLLQNRLVRLRMEEEKAQKKILETKKRAQEIIALKARNELANREKMMKQDDADGSISEATSRAAKQRSDQKARVQATQEELLQQKREGVLHTRRARQEHEMSIQRQRDADMQHAHQCKEAIKAHEVAMQRQQHEKRIERSEQCKKELDDKVLEEEQQRTLAEVQVRRMEAEEAYLIEQLQKTQEQQRSAYDSLEQALTYEIGE